MMGKTRPAPTFRAAAFDLIRPFSFLLQRCNYLFKSICDWVWLLYTKPVRINGKLIWLAILLLPLPFLAGGCGGINAGTTVSPATFFLPGILRNDMPPATNAPCAIPANSPVYASARN